MPEVSRSCRESGLNVVWKPVGLQLQPSQPLLGAPVRHQAGWRVLSLVTPALHPCLSGKRASLSSRKTPELACRSTAHRPFGGSGKELLLPADPGLEEEGEESQDEKYVQLQETRLRE